MEADLLVSPAWLGERLAGVRVLDVRGEVAPEEPRYRAHPDRYRAGHIPGAVFVDWRHDFSDPADAVPVQLAPPDRFARRATELGIGDGDVVVAYDAYFNILAGRIAWAFRAYGHRRAHVLDGGWDEWRRAGGAVEAGAVEPRPADPPYTPPAAPAGRLDLEAMRAALAAGAVAVDARSDAEYRGEETHARRAGRIPGARSVHYRRLLDARGRFRPAAELRGVLADAGVPVAADGPPLVAYCNGGVSATAVATAVQLATGRQAGVYDGSWNEWGNRDDTPVEAG